MPQTSREFRRSGHRPPDERGGTHSLQYARTGAVELVLSTHGNRCDSWNLYLDKFAFATCRDGSEHKALKTEALQAVVKNYENASAPMKAAIESQNRLFASLQSQHGECFAMLPLVNSSRLVLHLGRASTLENVGIYCDRTTGLPRIPGMALKGALSTWACWEANQSSDGTFPEADQWTIARKDLSRRAFGDNSETHGREMAGGIMFLGGFPMMLPKLELDILTPHPDEGRGRITPNVFLSVAQGTTWNFAFLVLDQKSQDDLASVLSLAEECLCCNGLGAKTASGFGQFRPMTDEEKAKWDKQREAYQAARAREEREQMEKKQRESLPPEERAYREYVESQKDWTSAAREIESRGENEKQWILRYFRSEPGTALLKTWTNPKGLKRLESLRKAGL